MDKIKIHVLRTGEVRVSPYLPFGGDAVPPLVDEHILLTTPLAPEHDCQHDGKAGSHEVFELGCRYHVVNPQSQEESCNSHRQQPEDIPPFGLPPIVADTNDVCKAENR